MACLILLGVSSCHDSGSSDDRSAGDRGGTTVSASAGRDAIAGVYMNSGGSGASAGGVAGQTGGVAGKTGGVAGQTGGVPGQTAPPLFGPQDVEFFCESLAVVMIRPWEFADYYSEQSSRYGAHFDAKAADYLRRVFAAYGHYAEECASLPSDLQPGSFYCEQAGYGHSYAGPVEVMLVVDAGTSYWQTMHWQEAQVALVVLGMEQFSALGSILFNDAIKFSDCAQL